MSGQAHRPWTGAAIRMGGLVALGLSWLCGRELWLLHGPHNPTALEFLLATGTFIAACAGSAMLIVGPHLLDEVEVSERWRRRPEADDLRSSDNHGIRH